MNTTTTPPTYPARGSLAIHRTSGKFYRVIDEAWAVAHPEFVCVKGYRDGKPFGPIREIKRDALAPLDA